MPGDSRKSSSINIIARDWCLCREWTTAKTSEVGTKLSQDFVEKIATISAGVTKLEILEEKWNGETFWLKASITIDPKSLEVSLKQLVNDRQKVEELETLKMQLGHANEQLKVLTEELSKSKDVLQKKYSQEINIISSTDFRYQGNLKYYNKDYKGAIEDYKMAISLNPKDSKPYFNIGLSENELLNYAEAIDAYTKAINLDPNFATYYYSRAASKYNQKDYIGALMDCNKCIDIDPSDRKDTHCFVKYIGLKANIFKHLTTDV